MRKRIVSLGLVFALFAAALVGGTLAYFSDSKSADNVFTVGNVAIELTEPNWEGEDDVRVIANPGVAVDKDPMVKNVGSNDAWIRVDVTLSNATVFKTAMAKYGLTDLDMIFGGHDQLMWTRAGIVDDTVNDVLVYSYYYNNILSPTASTGALFTSVKLPYQFDNVDVDGLQGSFTITVKANAIQSAGLATVVDAFAAYNLQMTP